MTAKARVLRHSGRRQAPEKECPDWRNWRREALWHQTLFLLGFDPADRLTLSSAGIAVLDPDLEQGGNTNIVVRRDPATGEMTRVLVHRWCRPGRSPRSTSDALADA
jgi:hypothetical protein